MLHRSDFTTANVTAAPIVSMTIKDGKIQFNRAASTLLGLKEGDKVQLAYDKEKACRLWFRNAGSGDKDGFAVHRRIRRKENGVHCIISKPLVRRMQALLDTTYNINVQLGTEPENGGFWALESSYQFTKPRNNK